MNDLALSCSCGRVRGSLSQDAAASGNRVICCCSDCQAFMQFLGKEADYLDEYGGTDVFQTSPSSIQITQGRDLIRCARLTEKGINRWYTECCKTPIGNTMGPKMPFVGVIHAFWESKEYWNEMVGPSKARVQTKYARNLPQDAPKPVGFPLGVTLKIMLKILIWKLGGKGQPNPFFDADGKPLSTFKVVTTQDS